MPTVLFALLACACTSESPRQPVDSGADSSTPISCIPGGTLPCCEDVVATSLYDGTYEPAPDLVEGDVVGEEGFDATWVEVRAGSATHPSELVLDRDGTEVVMRFARPLAEFPTLAAGTLVHVALPSPHSPVRWTSGVWITDESGATIALVVETGYFEPAMELGPVTVVNAAPVECMVPTYISAPVPGGLCWIGHVRSDVHIDGLLVDTGATVALDDLEVTFHRLQTQGSAGIVGCAPRVQDEIVLEAWPAD